MEKWPLNRHKYGFLQGGNKWVVYRSFFGVFYLDRLVLVSLSMEKSKR
jgi:hypothetical protein